MTSVLLFFWILSALLIVLERKAVRLIVYLGVFSLISSGCFLLFAAPDVAMAEAVVSVFSTILFIVAFERYYSIADSAPETKALSFLSVLKAHVLPLGFTLLLLLLFIRFIPSGTINNVLKNQYLTNFQADIGGENAVTAVYLGYRMYDTLFEALMLLVSIVTLVHLSWHAKVSVPHGEPSHIRDSEIAKIPIRLICPVLVLFSVYLVMNGHISPGGGFQGGVVVASLFVCRYMIHDIYDIRIDRVLTLEKLVFLFVVLLAVLFIVLGANAYWGIPKEFYLVLMNLLIGIKVACGFLIIFYRFIVLERR